MSSFWVRKLFCLPLAALVLFLLCSVRDVSGSDWIPINPDELKMTSVAEAPGAAAVLLYRQVDRDDNGTTSHQFNYFRIKILTEEGRKYADVEIPYWKGQEQIGNIRGRTIRPDGSIANFEGKAFDKSIVKAKGVKYLAKTLTLPDVQVGSIIEYYYTQNFPEYSIYDSHWIVSDELFTKKAKFSLKPFASSYSNLMVRWSWANLAPGSDLPKQGKDNIVRLEVSNIPAFPVEDYMPPANELKARVDFIYSSQLTENDPDKYWKLYGKTVYGVVEGSGKKRKDLDQALAQIVSPTDVPEAKLRKIYDRVQRLRNTSYEEQKTVQEEKRNKEKTFKTSDEVWKTGAGDEQELNLALLGAGPGGRPERLGRSGPSTRSLFLLSECAG